MTPTVAIIGMPNVGKSSLFNRMVGRREAIVDDIGGVTRDRIYGEVEWNGKTFTLIDTGGFVPHKAQPMEQAVRQQAEIAMDEATLILFMVDVTAGITADVKELATLLRPQAQKVFLVVNKVDNHQRMLQGAEFYALGFQAVFFISAANGQGTGDLLDAITERLPAVGPPTPATDLPIVAIVGQPNVGKSSLLNVLLGEHRAVVTDIAGTTRDVLRCHYKKFNKEFILLDTAGLRKKSKVYDQLEFYSVIRAIKAIDEADVCVLLVDARHPMQKQDLHILGLIERKRKGAIIAVNKWDLIPHETNTMKYLEEEIRQRIAPFSDIPIVFISALQKQRIYKLTELILSVYKNRRRYVDDKQLTETLLKATAEHPHPAVGGRPLRFFKAEQYRTNPPAFRLFTNRPDEVAPNYRGWLEKRIRENFDFQGVPIKITFAKK
ncbi:MAG: ribosome biogenesis GTPase Der [Chitinophagales bacterium]|nr:ribosome biogenesis GTPase Der [Chitinophagales bacterium]MDW8427964.1 ribosome biogenesis GTPase Der [Chitinophagales bacterium]